MTATVRTGGHPDPHSSSESESAYASSHSSASHDGKVRALEATHTLDGRGRRKYTSDSLLARHMGIYYFYTHVYGSP